MIIYKRNFDENRHIYFFIKQEKVFIKYVEIFEKIRKIIKKKILIMNSYIVKNI